VFVLHALSRAEISEACCYDLSSSPLLPTQAAADQQTAPTLNPTHSHNPTITQSCPSPARDVFSRSSDLVSSVVVLPLLVSSSPNMAEGTPDQAPLGGLYFALGSSCDFENLRDALLGFVHVVAMALNRKLARKISTLEACVARAVSDPRCSRTAGWLSGFAPIAHVVTAHLLLTPDPLPYNATPRPSAATA